MSTPEHLAKLPRIIQALRNSVAWMMEGKTGLTPHVSSLDMRDAADVLEQIAPLPEAPPATIDKCYSTNGEDFNYSSLADVLETLGYQGALQVGQKYHAGDSTTRRPSHFFDIDTLINQMKDSAADDCGEYADSFLDELSKEKVAELDAIICNWLDRNAEVHFYTVTNAEEVTITEQDLIAHADALQQSLDSRDEQASDFIPKEC